MYVKTTTDRKTMKSSSCADIAAPGYRNIECKRERERDKNIKSLPGEKPMYRL